MIVAKNKEVDSIRRKDRKIRCIVKTRQQKTTRSAVVVDIF
jgi:hypothetical protein